MACEPYIRIQSGHDMIMEKRTHKCQNNSSLISGEEMPMITRGDSYTRCTNSQLLISSSIRVQTCLIVSLRPNQTANSFKCTCKK